MEKLHINSKLEGIIGNLVKTVTAAKVKYNGKTKIIVGFFCKMKGQLFHHASYILSMFSYIIDYLK